MTCSKPEFDPIIRKLEATFVLTDEERDAVCRLPLQPVVLRTDQDIVREGDRPTRCFAILEGFTCSYKMAADGKRQIVNFHIPGDMPDLHSLHLTVLDTSFATITPCKVGFIQHEPMRELCFRYPRLAGAFWRQTLIDASIFREWMTNIGRREAFSRIAHFLCEMVVRMEAVGMVDESGCELPITQAEIGDAQGLSYVHVNRTIKDLREAGLVRQAGKKLVVQDWEGLQEAGDFDPAYLHLNVNKAAA